jgi:hypothetical protein
MPAFMAATTSDFACQSGVGHGGFIQQGSPTDRLRRPLASTLNFFRTLGKV